MCGIAGEIGLRGAHARTGLVELLGERVAHRGPDGKGFYCSSDRRVALAHRRLAILDLSESGAQPMVNRSNQSAVVFNGEIYNYLELKTELQGMGYRFEGHSDTEVVLVGYQAWGLNLADRLRGMFAFVIHDFRRGVVIISRDRLGIKPLYLASESHRLTFCSELDPLRDALGARTLNRTAIGQLLFYRHIPDGKTIWKSIEKFPAGEIWELEIESGHITRKRYWDIREVCLSNQKNLSGRNLCCELRNEVGSAIDLHMRSDVPVGVLLSGGIDSTTLLSCLRRRLPSAKIMTFSIGFGAVEDELATARETARRYSTEHYELKLNVGTIEAEVDKLSARFGEPLADSSAIPFMKVSELVSPYAKVVLGGDGGDELFYGYKWYRANRYLSSIPQVSVAARLAKRFRRQKSLSLGLRALGAEGQLRLDILHGAPFTMEEIGSLVRNSGGFQSAGSYFSELREEQRMRVYDLQNFTMNSVLHKVDVASMGYGLEVRVPFLDHHLVEFALKLPSKVLFSNHRGKAILRDCYGADLPAPVLAGRKRGFSLPIRAWASGIVELAKMRLPDGVAVQSGLLDAESVNRALNGQCSSQVAKTWPLLVFESWLRKRRGWA